MEFKEWAFIRFTKRFGKYIVATILFGILIIYSDDNNLRYRIKLESRIHELKGDIKHYEGVIKESSAQLDQLRNDGEKLERFARENYLMKKADEDIFIVEEQKAHENAN